MVVTSGAKEAPYLLPFYQLMASYLLSLPALAVGHVLFMLCGTADVVSHLARAFHVLNAHNSHQWLVVGG
jgi:hypothetical protein